MAAFFLALVLLARPDVPPQIVQRFAKQDACALAQMKANGHPQMQTPEAREADAMFICLAVVDTSY